MGFIGLDFISIFKRPNAITSSEGFGWHRQTLIRIQLTEPSSICRV
jgi:hypothetical protein